MNNDYQTYKVVDYGFQINPELPVVGYTEKVTNAVCVSHAHPRAQLIYATNGVMYIVVENRIWVVNPLQGLWIPGNTEHQVSFQKDVNLYSVFIDPSFANNLPKTTFSFDISEFLKQLIFKVITFDEEKVITITQRRIMDVFMDELAMIQPSATFLPTTNHQVLSNVVQLLLDDVASKYTIDHYAEISCMSSRTLSRLFIRELGMNFSEWRIRLKLVEAIKRLGEKQSVKEIAFDLGYETTSAFIHMFKKHLGKTPANYIMEATM